MKMLTLLLIVTTAVTLVIASGAVTAANRVCQAGSTSTDPCLGTKKTRSASGNDTIVGTSGPDYIQALSGNDRIAGNGGNDTTNGGEGNDSYSYRDNFGTDTLVDASGIDSVNLSRISPSPDGPGFLTAEAWLVPEWVASSGDPFYNSATNWVSGGRVSFGASTVEVATGSGGSDKLVSGAASNTLMPGPGGNDYLLDLGGQPSLGDPERPPLPASSDTYKGFRSGFATIEDEGGSKDVVDLRPVASGDAHFEREGNDLLVYTTGTADGIRIRDYFTTGGRIERVIFADTTITGFEEASAMVVASAEKEKR